jgi:hypothetical protein
MGHRWSPLSVPPSLTPRPPLGRNHGKLNELRAKVSASSKVNLDQIEILVGDINDPGSIQRIASRTKVDNCFYSTF